MFGGFTHWEADVNLTAPTQCSMSELLLRESFVQVRTLKITMCGAEDSVECFKMLSAKYPSFYCSIMLPPRNSEIQKRVVLSPCFHLHKNSELSNGLSTFRKLCGCAQNLNLGLKFKWGLLAHYCRRYLIWPENAPKSMVHLPQQLQAGGGRICSCWVTIPMLFWQFAQY